MLIWTQLWKTRTLAHRELQKKRCSFHNRCILHNAHRSIADELRLSITISSYVLVDHLLIRSFIYLFIAQMKMKIEQPAMRRTTNEKQKKANVILQNQIININQVFECKSNCIGLVFVSIFYIHRVTIDFQWTSLCTESMHCVCFCVLQLNVLSKCDAIN